MLTKHHFTTPTLNTTCHKQVQVTLLSQEMLMLYQVNFYESIIVINFENNQLIWLVTYLVYFHLKLYLIVP